MSGFLRLNHYVKSNVFLPNFKMSKLKYYKGCLTESYKVRKILKIIKIPFFYQK